MADEVSQASAPTPPASSGKGNKAFLVIIVVLIVVFVAGGFFLINKMRLGSSTSSNASNSQAANPTEAAPTVVPIVETSYTCQDKKTMKVTYDNTSHTAKVVLSDGRTMTLAQTPSGSGVKYSNSDGTIVLNTQSGSAFLTENGKKTYESCSSGS